MDCNKEEAIRCRGIAEKKMQNNEYLVARGFLLKAQHLCKDLENVSKMLTVCDVHCLAQKRLFGDEMDWYGILQLVETADEVMIKKQFRKFALLLHPDKNNFPGAESAFKLIGQAQTVLLDKSKRSLHDIKRKSSVCRQPPPSTNWSSFRGTNSHRADAPQDFSNSCATFWTACPHCKVKFQYFLDARNKCIICYTCSKQFTAFEINVQGASSAFSFSQPVFPKSQDYQAASKVNGKSNTGNLQTELPQKRSGASGLNSEKGKDKKRKKPETKGSERCETESSIDSAEEIAGKVSDNKVKKNFGQAGEKSRRSNRQRVQVSYNENISDEGEFESPPKKAKWSGSTCTDEEDVAKKSGQSSTVSGVNYQSSAKQKESPESVAKRSNDFSDVKVEQTKNNDSGKSSVPHADPTSACGSKSAPEPSEMCVCPDPEFNDFDKGRDGNRFSAGQVWAVYDDRDVMPRFYAQIKKVFSSDFKVCIRWLEPDPDEKNQVEWVGKGFPISCGKYRHGTSENTEDRLMFSHLICLSKGSQRDTYRIFPRKGEAWALFRNWDTLWKCESDDNQVYEFEFVEILSEYTKGVGVWVGYLGKLKGFVSLFCRIRKDGKEKFLLPPDNLFRFSHSIRSFEMTGEEREGVPKGSLELDPASLPEKVDEVAVPEDIIVQVDDVNNPSEAGRGAPWHKSDENGFGTEPEVVIIEDEDSSSDSSIEDVDLPEPEFFDFDKEKSTEKFCVGQVWSLYSDEEGLPKYYAQISSVSDNPFDLQVNWLIPCKSDGNLIQWEDKDMPICCGKFKTSRDKHVSYDSTGAFSHQLKAVQKIKKNVYVVVPAEGQVWALYRDWSPAIKRSELKNCKYDIVEVLEQTEKGLTVLVLVQVDDFNSVFKVQVIGGSRVTMVISHAELFRFSHQIPAFKLTEEKGGILRGFWELDPLALPVHFFATD